MIGHEPSPMRIDLAAMPPQYDNGEPEVDWRNFDFWDWCIALLIATGVVCALAMPVAAFLILVLGF